MSTTPLPAGTVTFLATDVEGSTRLWERDPVGMSAALARHDAAVRTAVERHAGTVFKALGDAFWAAFASPADALGAAADAQRALFAMECDSPPLRVRMAVHTGIAEPRGGDYFGPPLNTCARLLSIARGGHVLASGTAVDLVGLRLPEGCRLADLGEHRLRDVPAAVHVYRLQLEASPADIPGDLGAGALDQNLPGDTTPFVGRAAEIAQVLSRLARSRIVTLTGIAGVGKSRLALEVARRWCAETPVAACYLDLAALGASESLTRALAMALCVREEANRPLVESVAARLGRTPTLVLLDNCERAAEGCAALVDDLARRAPATRFLVTSRTPIGVSGEAICRIDGLRAETPSDDAPTLFAQRAVLVRGDFALDGRTADVVARVCRRLDGLPLAIELAAARTAVLSVSQIEARLDRRFQLLTRDRRSAGARHLALREAMDESYDMLGDRERALLRRLSVFAGGCSLDAAESICAGDDLSGSEILDAMSGLVSWSLVGARDLSRSPRYALLETVRAYSGELLAESGELRLHLARHAAHYADLVRAAEAELRGPNQRAWLEQLDVEMPNVRAAIDHYGATGDAPLALSLAAALLPYWLARAAWSEGRALLADLLDRVPEADCAPIRGRGLYADGVLARHQDDYAAAAAAGLAAIEALRSAAAPAEAAAVADCLNLLGIVAQRHDANPERARSLFGESLALRRLAGDERGVAVSLFNLSNIAIDHDADPEGARRLLSESLEILERLGDARAAASARRTLGTLAAAEGELDTAGRLIGRSLDAYRDLGDRAQEADALVLLGEISIGEGALDTAEARLSEALGVAEAIDSPWLAARGLTALGHVARRRGDGAAARALYERGLERATAIRDGSAMGEALASLGELALAAGDADTARSLLLASLDARMPGEELPGIAQSLDALASVAAALGRDEPAVTLAAAADALREAGGTARLPFETVAARSSLEGARRRLGAESAARAEARGRGMGRDEAAAYARAALPGAASHGDGSG